MGEIINIEDRITQINEQVKLNNDQIEKINNEFKKLNIVKQDLYNVNKSLESEKQAWLARLKQSEISFKFISKYKNHIEYKYTGKMNSPEHGFANCNKCLVPLELFKGNIGIGEVEIGVCPKCEIEINFTDCSRW